VNRVPTCLAWVKAAGHIHYSRVAMASNTVKFDLIWQVTLGSFQRDLSYG